jgi:VTC domain-containing protein
MKLFLRSNAPSHGATGRPRIRSVTRDREASSQPYPQSLERRARVRTPLHFQRIELKYFLPERILPHFIHRISPFTDVDPYLVKEGRGRTSYPVTSLYFDSWDLHAWDEKEDGQFFRRKLRLRTYEDEFRTPDPSFLEIKRRLDSVVLKDRLSLPTGAVSSDVPVSGVLRHLLSKVEDRKDRTLIEAELMCRWFNLQPAALVRYQRLALVGKEDSSTRVTVDRHLQGAWRPVRVLGNVPMRTIDSLFATGMSGVSGRYGMLELKCNNVVPMWFHRAVQDLELMRTAFSKYYLVVMSLRPQIYEDCEPAFAHVGGL